MIEVGPDYTVGDGGDLTLRAGTKVAFGNGTTIVGALTVEIDEALQAVAP